MKCNILKICLIILTILSAFPEKALTFQGLPGSTWDQISYDDDNLVGTGAIGYFNQGIDWTTLPGGITFNTFAELRYRFRSENKPYYNMYGEAAGVEFKKSIFHLGVDYYWQQFPALPDHSNEFEYYLSWFYDWNLKGKKTKIIKDLPGSTWNHVFYNASSLEGNGVLGYLNQGIDWTTLPGGITFNTFAELRYRFRSENRPYYNTYGEAIGIELKKSIFHFGIDYIWEHYPELTDQSNKLQIYVSWFYDWDLKPKSPNKNTVH